jgi:glutamate-1-semialdehyde aminotransferase
MSLSYTGTFSKSPQAWGFEKDLVVTCAEGAEVGLSDGKWYVDWVSGLGTNLLGYGTASQRVHRAVISNLQGGGGSLSLPHRLEAETAEKLSILLSENIADWNNEQVSVRFAKTGSDVTTMSIRLARAVTGRPYILTMKGGYHGWGDWTISRTRPAWGVTATENDYIDEAEFNRLEDLPDRFDIAAVIIEQSLEIPQQGYYYSIRKWCDARGALLIMDEIVTGLRYALGGVCELYRINPDLVCMGKALGNGLPISALVGKKEYMDWFARNDPVFCSSTFWGESVGLAAASAMLDMWDEPQVYYISSIGGLLIDGLRSAGWNVIGDPPRSLVGFSGLKEQAFFIHGMREEGVLMNRPNFPTLSHTEEMVDRTVEAAMRVHSKYNAALERGVLDEKVEGKLPRVLFSNR